MRGLLCLVERARREMSWVDARGETIMDAGCVSPDSRLDRSARHGKVHV